MRLSDKIPAYEGGVKAEGLYNAGPLLADDSLAPTAEDSPMMFVTGTNEKEFERYVGKLEAEGWHHNDSDGCGPAYCSVEAWKDDVKLYAYLTRATGVVRIIEQRAGEQTCAAGFYPYDGEGTEEIV